MNIRQKRTPEEIMKAKPLTDGIAIYGIVDDLGVDQIYRSDKKLANIHYLRLRCRYNSQRNARLFCCIIKEKYIPSFDMKDRMELFNELKRRSVYVKDPF